MTGGSTPGPRGTRAPASGAGPARRGHVLLAYLAGLPRIGVFLGGLVLVLAGLFLPGWVGMALLLAVVVGLVGVLTVTWPRLPAARRGLQVLVLLVLLACALSKLV